MDDKKIKITYAFEAKGVEDIEKAKLRLDEMTKESWKKGFPYDKAHEFYQEIEHIVKEIKKIYPEMNLLEDNFKYILGRKKGDSIDNEVSNAIAVQAGVNSLLKEISLSKQVKKDIEEIIQ